jgi:hypothetical protein
MGNVFSKVKGFFASGTILANIGVLLAALDQLVGQLESIQPLLPPKASAAVVGVLAVIAIIRRVAASAKIVGLF